MLGKAQHTEKRKPLNRHSRPGALFFGTNLVKMVQRVQAMASKAGLSI